jgi:protein involved in polysaccharide export with SLBB domain
MRKPTLLLFLILTALTLRAIADVAALDPLAKPSTRLGPGYEVSLSVAIRGLDEKDLCKQFTLDNEAKLQVKLEDQPIDKIPLLGLTAAQARERISIALRKYFAVEPEVRVGISRIPRFKVHVFGATLQAGPLTLPDGAHLSDALMEARYILRADLQHVHIDRVEKGEKVRLLVDFSKALQGIVDKFTDPALQNGDVITLDVEAMVEPPKTFGIHGEVRKPGFYPFKKGMTVRDGMDLALGMLPTADPERVTVVRTKRGTFMTVNGLRALQGVATDNVELQPDDIITVAIKDQGQKYAVVGAVAAPTSFEYKGKITLKQAIVDCGGFRPEADRKNVLLVRNMLHDPAHPQTVQIDFDKITRGEQPDIPLEAGDVVQVLPKKKQPNMMLDFGMVLLKWFLPF